MQPFRIVFYSPPFDYNLRVLQRAKNLSIQTLISQLPVEAPTVAVLPRSAGLELLSPSARAITFTGERSARPKQNHCGAIGVLAHCREPSEITHKAEVNSGCAND